MIKGEIVSIKQYEDIDKEIKGGPGWADDMSEFCGKEWRVYSIDDNSNKWIWLEEIENFVWDENWLVNKNDMEKFDIKEFEI